MDRRAPPDGVATVTGWHAKRFEVLTRLPVRPVPRESCFGGGDVPEEVLGRAPGAETGRKVSSRQRCALAAAGVRKVGGSAARHASLPAAWTPVSAPVREVSASLVGAPPSSAPHQSRPVPSCPVLSRPVPNPETSTSPWTGSPAAPDRPTAAAVLLAPKEEDPGEFQDPGVPDCRSPEFPVPTWLGCPCKALTRGERACGGVPHTGKRLLGNSALKARPAHSVSSRDKPCFQLSAARRGAQTRPLRSASEAPVWQVWMRGSREGKVPVVYVGASPSEAL